MSPVEAKAYGIIDGVIGGDMATMVVEGDVTGACPPHPTYLEAYLSTVARTTHGMHARDPRSECTMKGGTIGGPIETSTI